MNEEFIFLNLEKVLKENYIHKDKIKEILGIEEDISKDKILSLIKTIFEECERLEDVEDKKVQVEVQNIERKRDKYWKDKIKEKIKEYEDTYMISDIAEDGSKEDYKLVIIVLQELLEE